MLIYIGYLIISVLYVLLNYKSFKPVLLYVVLLVVCMPFFGLLVIVIFRSYRPAVNDNGIFILDDDYDNVIVAKIGMEKELNNVPLEEALHFNNTIQRREMIMQTLFSDDLYEYIEVLKKALDNVDSETAHYATAVIMQMQNDIIKTVNIVERNYLSKPDDFEMIVEYEACLYLLISSSVFDRRNLIKYLGAYEHLFEAIMKKGYVNENFYTHRIQYDLINKDYTHAKELCVLYTKKFPQSEEMVLCNLCYYIDSRDRQGLDNFFEKLDTLPVRLTNMTIQYIRFLNNREGD